ncbi:NCS2 family permease [bacterium]|nr:NCS2 family permease [bacterium]
MQQQDEPVPFDIPTKYPIFVRRDLDGFFGLFVDNLVQILVITSLCTAMAGLSADFIFKNVLPAVALSVLVGNLFYSWQAWRLAKREGRADVTALPYGINTPSVIAFILFIMAPVYAANKATFGDQGAAMLAWKVGMVSCLASGVIEFLGAFAAGWLRSVTPRAALLGSLAGIAIGFISMTFTLQAFERPLLALVPLGVILIQYFSGVRLPLGIPAGMLALIIGSATAWGLKYGLTHDWLAILPGHLAEPIRAGVSFEVAHIKPENIVFSPKLYLPILAVKDLLGGFSQLTTYIAVIVPMALFNLIGSLQNIESAEAEGDRYATFPSLAVNGLCSIVAAAFGSCFPTTIYIGHAGWKRLGARTGYSALNGIVISALCWGGLIGFANSLIPQEAIVGILVWIAVIIGAQAFQAIPRAHAPAVVLALFPTLAAWGLVVLNQGIISAKSGLDAIGLAGIDPNAHLGGMISLDHGFIITSMAWGALGVCLIERKFFAAANWTAAMAFMSFFGLIHAWNPVALSSPVYAGIGTGWRYAIPYAIITLILLALAPRAAKTPAGAGH